MEWITLETYLDGNRENGDGQSTVFAVPDWWLENYFNESGWYSLDIDTFLDFSAGIFEETLDIYWSAKNSGNILSETDYPL